MSLPPSKPLDPFEVELSGGTVKVLRGLTLGEVQMCKKLGEGKADELAIHLATGIPREEVSAWLAGALAGDAEELIGAIFKSSRYGPTGEAAQFQGQS